MLDPKRFKVARCSRRAGKSFADAVYFILECLANPNTPCLYLGLTRESAKEAIWPILVMILELLKIPHEALSSGPRINFPNGSYIQLLGANAINARNRIRGRKFKLVIADEMGFFTEGDSLIYDLLPTLADLSGTLAMTSSPGKVMHGIFYEADQGKLRTTWSQHFWTLLENPFFMGPASNPKYTSRGEEELHNIVNMQFGGDWNNADFRREYLGEWVNSIAAMVYPIMDKNIVNTDVHLDEPEYALGFYYAVDADYAAIVTLKFSQYDRRAIFIETVSKEGATEPEFAELLQAQIAKYKPTHVVGHEGKTGGLIKSNLMARYQIHVQMSDIIDKSYYQRIFAGDIITGQIFVDARNSAILLDEWKKAVKDVNGDEIAGPPNYAANAALSVYKRIYSAFLKSSTPKKTEEQRMIEHITDTYRQEKEDAEDWL